MGQRGKITGPKDLKQRKPAQYLYRLLTAWGPVVSESLTRSGTQGLRPLDQTTIERRSVVVVVSEKPRRARRR
jgi:hypothetical protein